MSITTLKLLRTQSRQFLQSLNAVGVLVAAEHLAVVEDDGSNGYSGCQRTLHLTRYDKAMPLGTPNLLGKAQIVLAKHLLYRGGLMATLGERPVQVAELVWTDQTF